MHFILHCGLVVVSQFADKKLFNVTNFVSLLGQFNLDVEKKFQAPENLALVSL